MEVQAIYTLLSTGSIVPTTEYRFSAMDFLPHLMVGIKSLLPYFGKSYLQVLYWYLVVSTYIIEVLVAQILVQLYLSTFDIEYELSPTLTV